ncbi:MAG: alpha/beta hydrolase, partial [Planctomycetaceae bacterium]|nr:alpha/beta hydrolase [Planctomycetaceae bacterium]
DPYCDRPAFELRSHEKVIIGGASFGGIVALHVAQRLKPLAVILIGSVRSPEELPRIARFCRLLKPVVPLIPGRLLQFCCMPLASRFGRYFAPHLSGLARQFRNSDPRLFKWSLSQLLGWKCTPAVNCAVYHIHGDWDLALPIRYTRPDEVIAGGGHVISLTHPTEVNRFIQSVIDQTVARE